MFITVEDDLFRIPANIDVIMTIKKTAKVIPTSSAANLPLSFTNSLYAILRIPFTPVLLGCWPSQRGNNHIKRYHRFYK